MQKEMFEELLLSVKEAKDIMRGKKESSRKFYIEEPDAKETSFNSKSICIVNEH